MVIQTAREVRLAMGVGWDDVKVRAGQKQPPEKDDSNCHQGTPRSTVRASEPEMSPRAQHDSIKTATLWLKQRTTQAERKPPAEQSGQASRRRFREYEDELHQPSQGSRTR